MHSPDLAVDLFAGGGGASTGIEMALGRPVDVAINHDEVAIAVHKRNHPGTRHFRSSVWEVKPQDATQGKPVGLLWASPDCRHFSNAKGDVPKSKKIRSLATVVIRWAKAVRPRVICLENVPEFQTWGPLSSKTGRPIPERKGETFRWFIRKLERFGYVVDWRILDASLYGAPTRRRRLFLVARCDGQPIVWPEPTHGPGRLPLRTAAECIDWSLPCPSIFARKRPLAAKTQWRIAEGLRRYVLENPQPFIVQVNHGKLEHRGQQLDLPLSTITAARRSHAIVTPILATTRNGERRGQRARAHDLREPYRTITAQGSQGALVTAFLAKHFGGVVGHGVDRPASTITCRDHHSLAAATLVKLRGDCHSSSVDAPAPTMTAGGTHLAEVRAFLVTYYSGGSKGQRVDRPLRTITTKDRLGLVTIAGTQYAIVDIGMRMLQPHELKLAQGFPADYDLGPAETKEDQVRLIGNSVPPHVAAAVVRANYPTQLEAAA